MKQQRLLISRKPKFYDTSVLQMIHAVSLPTMADTMSQIWYGTQWLIMEGYTYFQEQL